MTFATRHLSITVFLVCLSAIFPDFSRAQEQDAPAQLPAVQTPQEQVPPEIVAVPNRPTIASTAEVVQPGVLELEYGFEGGDGHQNVNGLVKFGLTKWLEVRVANNPMQRDTAIFSTGDSGAGFKLRLIPQKGNVPTITLLYAATFPTASHGLGANAYGHAIQLLVSKDFGKHHFDWNEGIQLSGRPFPLPSGYDRGYFSALSYSRPLRGKWGFTAELAGTSKINDATPGEMTILFAPTYNVSPRLVLDAGAYVAAYGSLPRVTAFFGVTYSIGDFYHHRKKKTDHN